MRRKLSDVDNINVGLSELAITALLWTLTPPGLLNLIPPEREFEVPSILENVPRKGHGEVKVQPPTALLGLPAKPRDRIDLLISIRTLCAQSLDRLDGAGLD